MSFYKLRTESRNIYGKTLLKYTNWKQICKKFMSFLKLVTLSSTDLHIKPTLYNMSKYIYLHNMNFILTNERNRLRKNIKVKFVRFVIK